MDATTILEHLPADVYNHFNLGLLDLISLTTTSKYISNLILTSNIKTNSVTTYSSRSRKWIRFMSSIKITNENLGDIELFTNIITLDLSGTKIVDVSKLGRVRTLDL